MDSFKEGVEVKLFQYKPNRILPDKTISISDLIGNQQENCVMINLEKDIDRYSDTVKELEKVGINNFVHLKGTYWKQKESFENDLTMVKQFLKQFIRNISLEPIKIDLFSETNDRNIHIQDGPLACLVSHLRALIYGYLYFSDYTIIVEDDIQVDTEMIEKLLPTVPNDWDIITLGAIGKDSVYPDSVYRFTSGFHSTHFYIVKNSSMETIFKGVYPFYDQIDVIISDLNLKNDLKIYNVPNAVYQRNHSTNTQNNLHAIMNAKYYNNLREHINIIKKTLLEYANKILYGDSEQIKRNEIIIDNVIYDTLFHNLSDVPSSSQDTTNYLIEFEQCELYKILFEAIYLFIQCAKKDINVETVTRKIMNGMIGVIDRFKLHDPTEYSAYGYGSTSQVYFIPQKQEILKVYNDLFCWTTKGHDNWIETFNKEVSFLEMGLFCAPTLKNSYEGKILMTYNGESLYNDFNLPENWKQKLELIFLELSESGIVYSEFKLQNILVKDSIITFADYGLAYQTTVENATIINNQNLTRFVNYLDILNDKFKEVVDPIKRYQYIYTFLNNVSNEKHCLKIQV